MTPEEVVKGFYIKRKSLIDLYFNSENHTEVSELISTLNLNTKQTEILRLILNSVLRDAYYGILLGLDGEASIGERQEIYKIEDEEGDELSYGEIAAFAWEYFHNNKFEIDKKQADFIATLKYRTYEEGGRRTPVKSGYRPHIKFPFAEMQTSGQQTFIDRELVFPGDTVEAEIIIVSIDYFEKALTEGMEFEF